MFTVSNNMINVKESRGSWYFQIPSNKVDCDKRTRLTFKFSLRNFFPDKFSGYFIFLIPIINTGFIFFFYHVIQRYAHHISHDKYSHTFQYPLKYHNLHSQKLLHTDSNNLLDTPQFVLEGF